LIRVYYYTWLIMIDNNINLISYHLIISKSIYTLFMTSDWYSIYKNEVFKYIYDHTIVTSYISVYIVSLFYKQYLHNSSKSLISIIPITTINCIYRSFWYSKTYKKASYFTNYVWPSSPPSISWSLDHLRDTKSLWPFIRHFYNKF
jgi:hypothetical protein